MGQSLFNWIPVHRAHRDLSGCHVLLFCLALVCSTLAGYRMSGGQRRSWLHILGFTVVTVVIAYVTLDAY